MLTKNWILLRECFQPKSHLYLLIFSILIQAFGAICTKYAAESNPTDLFFGIPFEYIIYFIILGGMGLQVLVWQYALKYYSLSFAYPFRSLFNFIVLLSAYFLFHESISLLNFIGLSMITIGVFYLAKDKEILS
jgi:multidrug transporter EmrE-like cation transporter